MRVTMLPKVSRRLLPEEGNWHLEAGWQAMASRMADAATVRAATQGLLSVFTPGWAAKLPHGDREIHPFEHWYALGGGVGLLLHLGWCLHLIPASRHLAEELVAGNGAAWDRFDAAAAEARAGALAMALGGEVTWVDVAGERRPDFVARFGPHQVAFEVKQLNDGEVDSVYAQIDGSFWEAFTRAEAEATRDVGAGGRATHAVIRAPVGELEQLALADPPDLAAARALGSAIGRRLGDFIASAPNPGTHLLGEDLEVTVFAPSARHAGHGHESSSVRPPAGTYVKQAMRLVRKAATQLASLSRVGVVILERRWPQSFPPGVPEGLGDAIARGELPEVAALVLREEARVESASRTAETITVLPGPRWAELPQQLRDALPPECPAYGYRRAALDLLGWIPGQPTPWIHGPEIDESTNDAATIARSTPPEAKLRQALEHMRVGFALERANLRARNPYATAAEIDAAFRAWQLRDG